MQNSAGSSAMKMTSGWIVGFFFILLLIACVSENSIERAKPIKIISVDTTIAESNDYSFFGGDRSTGVEFSITFDGSVSVGDIFSLCITDSAGLFWRWSSDELKKEDWEEANSNLWLGFCSTSGHKDSIPLGSYLIEIYDMNNAKTSFSFKVKARSDGSPESGSIYSHEAGKNPAILHVPLLKNAVKKNGALIIDFEIDDPLVTDSYLRLYENDKYLGFSDWLNTGGPKDFDKNIVSMKVKLPYEKANYVRLVAYSTKKSIPNEVDYTSISTKQKIKTETEANSRVTVKALAYGSFSNDEGKE